MKLKYLHLICCALCMTLIFSCNKDEACDGVTCPSGYTAVETDGNCDCVQTGVINPCVGVTCPEGFTAVANGDNCDCNQNPDDIGQVAVTGQIADGTTWTKDKIYVLNGKVVVDNGATLTIEAGTVIKRIKRYGQFGIRADHCPWRETDSARNG